MGYFVDMGQEEATEESFESQPEEQFEAEMQNPPEDAQVYDPPPEPSYIPPPAARSAPQRPIVQASAPKAVKRRRRRRAQRRHRAAQRAGRRRGVVTASGACCGISLDGDTNDVTFDLYRTGNGWSAILRLPAKGGKTLSIASSPSPTKAKATRKSINMAARVTANPMVQAMLPPQARLAARALQSPAGRATLKAARRLF
jgi:hypothetical protein